MNAQEFSVNVPETTLNAPPFVDVPFPQPTLSWTQFPVKLQLLNTETEEELFIYTAPPPSVVFGEDDVV